MLRVIQVENVVLAQKIPLLQKPSLTVLTTAIPISSFHLKERSPITEMIRNEDAVDDLFIEDDGMELLNVELPMELSMNAHQDLATHFKIICQLFVHLIVRPAKAFLRQVISRQYSLTLSFVTSLKNFDYIADNEYFYPPLLVARRRLSNFIMLKRLCGKYAFENIAIVTTRRLK